MIFFYPKYTLVNRYSNGKWSFWRYISYWKMVMLVYQRVLPGISPWISARVLQPFLQGSGPQSSTAQVVSPRLKAPNCIENCHEFWLTYVRNTWGKKTTILSNTFNRMFALIFWDRLLLWQFLLRLWSDEWAMVTFLVDSFCTYCFFLKFCIRPYRRQIAPTGATGASTDVIWWCPSNPVVGTAFPLGKHVM